ncbi:MAG: SpoIIE family protein phosphatase [Xanthomonadaceae bacterium]|nr:SpoIIE family protein phosphatase [Xanthomonadaceae bacterium]MDE2496442.1 SpoIIE family protein phosphatase [Xanthomonadaceae bacterium]
MPASVGWTVTDESLGEMSVDSTGQAGEDATRKDLLEALLATTRALGGPETGSAAAELAEAARVHTGARTAALWRRDTQTGELTLLMPVRDPPPRLAAGAGLAGRCAEGARMLLEVDAGTAVDIIAVTSTDPDRAGRTGAVLSLPLVAGDTVLGVLQLLYESGRGFDPNTVLLAQVLAAEGALALRQQGPGEANTLHSEVEVARAIQRSTLPTQMPAVPGYDLYGHFQPATYAGGDMFDAVQLPTGVFLLLGDATGHGFGPALSAMEMQGMLRVAFRLGASLDEAYRHVNNQLTEDLPDDRFITAFMALLDPGTHSVRYHCAGQGPLLLYRAGDDRCEWITPTMFPVGVMELAETPVAATLEMGEGDILALISDGLFERVDAGNTEFGPERVAEVVRRGRHLPMAELCQRLLDAADAFADGIAAADDVTLILVRRLPDAENAGA